MIESSAIGKRVQMEKDRIALRCSDHLGVSQHVSEDVLQGDGGLEELVSRDTLFRGLPCIWNGQEYVLFSPYAEKVAYVESESLDTEETESFLARQSFFGKPLEPDLSQSYARLGLVLTTECSLRCDYCYLPQNISPCRMTPKYAVRAIQDRLRPNTKRVSILFFGGEPTMNMPALSASVDYMRSLGIHSQLLVSTNGILSEQTVDYLVSNGFIFSVSSDGPPEVTDIHRRLPGALPISSLVERAIRRVVDAGALIQVRATVTEETVHSLAEAVRYWSELGVKFAHIEPVTPCTHPRVNASRRPSSAAYVSNLMAALDEAEKKNMWIISSPYMNLLTPSDYFCTTVSGERILYMPDGSVSACYRVLTHGQENANFLLAKFDYAF